MAWFAVTSLMRTIELEFLQPNPRVVLHHTQAAEALHRRLRELLDFLEKSENQFNADEVTMQDWKARLKDVALRIEDEIESKVIAFYPRLDMMSPCSMDLAEFFRYTLENKIEELIKFGEKMKDLSEDLQMKDSPLPNEDLQMEDSPPLSEDLQMKDIPSSSEDLQMKSSGGGSELQNTMVGHTDELDHIKWMLLRDTPKETMVVPIVGMAGIGKTTFARGLYEDPSIASHFDILAWTTASARYDKRRMLLELLSSILPIIRVTSTASLPAMRMTNQIYNEGTVQLAALLRRRLLRKRYLIVLDDIWSIGSWDEIQSCFPNSNGSRILLTTRLHEVASYTSSGNYSLDMRFLTSYESWHLFHQRVLNYEKLPANLKRILEHIVVDYCKGLPLAIVLIAGLVQVTDESLWESSDDIERIFYVKVSSDLVEGISEILSLSYNHLPYSLKACFLYLGVFPEDSAIPMGKLIRLWIAEGFVMVEGQRSLEEIAEDYLKDLVSRSLVLINSINLDGKIKTCKVHDIVHDFCKRKAMEEGLLHVVDGHFGHSQPQSRVYTYRWVSIQTMNLPLHKLINAFNRSRSTLCFFGGGHCLVSYTKIKIFKMLRVLDVSTFRFDRNMMSGVADLVLLRYLALRPDWNCSEKLKIIWELPKNWNLQTLVLLADNQNRRVSDNPLVYEILGMPKLRHLQVSIEFTLLAPSFVQEHLQTIYWLPHFQCTKQVFLRIPNAKVMGIIQRSVNHSGHPPNWLDNLRYLRKLEKLKIKSRCNPILLPHASAFPVQLKKLTLKGTLLPWNAMEVIGVLPNLEVLKLKYGACEGLNWKLTGGGFCQLKSLLIHGTQLTHWTTTRNDFPILERLIIKECLYLNEIPSSFEDIYTLQLIELYHCPSQLVICARRIQEQQQDFGNNGLVVRDYYTRVITEEKEQKRREGDFEEQQCEKEPLKKNNKRKGKEILRNKNVEEVTIEEKLQATRKRDFEEQEPEKLTIEEKEQARREGDFEEQEREKIQEDEDAKLAFHCLANADFFNCFEDDLDDNDIN